MENWSEDGKTLGVIVRALLRLGFWEQHISREHRTIQCRFPTPATAHRRGIQAGKGSHPSVCHELNRETEKELLYQSGKTWYTVRK